MAIIQKIKCPRHKCGRRVCDIGVTRFRMKLSGGQQQRVAIARALASNAKVLLADEIVQIANGIIAS